MNSGTHTYIKSVLQRKPPDLPIICQWILDAWRELPSKKNVKAFKKGGICNAMDGTEGDCLWEDMESQEEDNKCSAHYMLGVNQYIDMYRYMYVRRYTIHCFDDTPI